MTQANAVHVLDIGLSNFEVEVVERSKKLPVLIDFWATWCAPCKTLGPVLEKLALESNGRFVLAKIDIDKSPELADAFGIQSVPSVILMKGGKPVDGFLGAQPEAQVRKFLEKNLGAAPIDYVAKAKELEAAGKREDALRLLRARTREAHDDGPARLMLAKLLVLDGKFEEAELLRAKLTSAELESEDGKSLVAALEFSRHRGELDALAAKSAAAPDDLAAAIAYGKALVAAGRHEEGLALLWKIAERDLKFEGGAPRKALIEVFGVVGFENPLVADYQRKLSILLCP